VEVKKDPKIHMPDGKHLSKKRADKIFHLDSRENAADGTATKFFFVKIGSSPIKSLYSYNKSIKKKIENHEISTFT
jgi:hypothetical protein